MHTLAGRHILPDASAWRRFGEGVWRLADPKVTLASCASMLLGAALAARAGPLAWGWLALTVAGIFALEAAKNASGELFDYASGTDTAVAAEDRSPFSGGKRVLVDGLLSPVALTWVAAAFYTAGIAAGMAIVAWREPRVLWLGLSGVGAAYFYHADPIRLSYRGFGELAVGIVYGPLIAAGTYLVQTGAWSRGVAAAAIPLGLLVMAFLWINEFPDYLADLVAGKATLVVRLGRPVAARIFAALVAVAFAALAVAPAFGAPRGVWLGVLGAPHAIAAVARLNESPEATARVVPAQAWTLIAFNLMALGAAAGVVWLP